MGKGANGTNGDNRAAHQAPVSLLEACSAAAHPPGVYTRQMWHTAYAWSAQAIPHDTACIQPLARCHAHTTSGLHSMKDGDPSENGHGEK